MTKMTQEQILNDLAGILSNFNGREYSGTIGPDTMFYADLGLASIDAVVLGETIEEHYNQKLPFNQLMAEMGQRAARDMSVGDLTAFLAKYLK
ncbi:MAG: acyl carrier protein [Gemmataceae bacterium]